MSRSRLVVVAEDSFRSHAALEKRQQTARFAATWESTAPVLLSPRPSSKLGSRFQILISGAPCSPVRQSCASRRPPSRLKLLGELPDDVPPPRRNGALDGPREGFFDGRFVWPKRDRLTRTYVSSRRVELTRVDVNRCESHTLHGFDYRDCVAFLDEDGKDIINDEMKRVRDVLSGPSRRTRICIHAALV